MRAVARGRRTLVQVAAFGAQMCMKLSIDFDDPGRAVDPSEDPPRAVKVCLPLAFRVFTVHRDCDSALIVCADVRWVPWQFGCYAGKRRERLMDPTKRSEDFRSPELSHAVQQVI